MKEGKSGREPRGGKRKGGRQEGERQLLKINHSQVVLIP